MRRTKDIDAPIPYIPAPMPDYIDIPPEGPGAGIQVGDVFVQLIPSAFELHCSCGHRRDDVQLGLHPVQFGLQQTQLGFRIFYFPKLLLHG